MEDSWVHIHAQSCRWEMLGEHLGWEGRTIRVLVLPKDVIFLGMPQRQHGKGMFAPLYPFHFPVSALSR